MQTCTECNIEKPRNEFGQRKAARTGLNTRCKTCVAAYQRAHYTKNKSTYVAKARRWNRENAERNRKKLLDYLTSHPCVDCGEDDPEVLEFDHRGDIAKSFAICDNIEGRSWDTLCAEIDKCDVRCANCHRRKTNRQLGYWRSRLTSTSGRASVS